MNFGKSKTIATVYRSVVSMGLEVGWISEAQRGCREVKELCMIHPWWI